MNFNDPNEFSSSPASAQSDDTGTQVFESADEGVDESTDSDDDEDLEVDETVEAVDEDDTLRSNGNNSTSSSGRLEAALQQAANQAGTQGIAYDEYGDHTMEMADDEVTNAFQPFVNEGKRSHDKGHASALKDQENLNPFSPAFKASIVRKHEEDEDPIMEMTQAVGGILTSSEDTHSSPKKRKARKSLVGTRRRSSVARRRSSGGMSNADGDETMDLTMSIGGIHESHDQDETQEPADEDEELTMEFTSVIGGVVEPNTKQAERFPNQGNTNRMNANVTLNEEAMDMTFAAGGILPSITEMTEPLEDTTMDVTTAIGAILPETLSTGDRTQAKHLMELETDAGQLTASPFHDGSPQKPMGAGLADERPLPNQLHRATMASETGIPSIATVQSHDSGRKSSIHHQNLTPEALDRQITPVKRLGTPSKQVTPQLVRPTTPGKTPPSKNVRIRTSSPKKLFKAEIKAGSSAKKGNDETPKSDFKDLLFRKDAVTGVTTPSIVLKPKRRRSSGLGADREGLGSPQVTEKLDRRGSIGDRTKGFVVQGKVPAGVRFEDPQIMGQELDQERAEDQRRESGRGILEAEVDDRDVEDGNATTTLKDMISSLTPQKPKLKGRKSLHIGAAKGLLGKRPAELDDDEDEDTTPKRLKGREGSPVKKVKLPAPPSKNVTTGRVTRSSRLSLGDTTANVRTSTLSGILSPSKQNTTPKEQSRFRNAEGQGPVKIHSFEQKLEEHTKDAELSKEEDRVHLQDFLNMTSIRFMELTTTKRRHTIAPSAVVETSSTRASQGGEVRNETDGKTDLENCVVAGACTVPMLELYQHSCRELKNYISEGRSIVKEIEADTYEDNPPLFREYMCAPPDVKSIMDNQFKNVKTHARLLSKAMWYEWRMKLLDGLKEGLTKIGEDMDQDDRSIVQQEQIMQPVLPGLIEEHDKLENQVQVAQAQADELAECDQEELKYARETLDNIDQDLQAKEKLVEELQNQLREKEDGLENAIERKQESIQHIKEAEKVLQDCRGWSSTEIAALQGMNVLATLLHSFEWHADSFFLANVDSLEATHGWTIAAANNLALTMTYKRSLQLFFTPSAFLPKDSEAETGAGENAPISLTYISDAHEYRPQPLTTEKRFFLQIIRAQLQCLQQSSTKVKNLLRFVAESWQSACAIVDEARILGISYITEPTITSDDVMAIRSSILLRPMRTKVAVDFEVKVRSGQSVDALDVGVKASAKVVYGESLKEKKMAEFLESKIKGVGRRGAWAEAVKELEERCLARGKK